MDMNIHPFGAGFPGLVGPAGIGCDFSGFSCPDFSSQWRVVPNRPSPVIDLKNQKEMLHMGSNEQLAKIRARFATPRRHAAHPKPLKSGDELSKPGSPRSPGKTNVFDALQQSPRYLLQDGSGSSPRGKLPGSQTCTMDQKVKFEELGGLEDTFMEELESSAEHLKLVDEFGEPGSPCSPGRINVFDVREKSHSYLLQNGSGSSPHSKLLASHASTMNQEPKTEELGGLEDIFMEELEISAEHLKLVDELGKPGSPRSPGQINVFDVLEKSPSYLLQNGSGNSPRRKLAASYTNTMNQKPKTEELWGLEDTFMKELEPSGGFLKLGDELGKPGSPCSPGQTNMFDALEQTPYCLPQDGFGSKARQEHHIHTINQKSKNEELRCLEDIVVKELEPSAE